MLTEIRDGLWGDTFFPITGENEKKVIYILTCYRANSLDGCTPEEVKFLENIRLTSDAERELVRQADDFLFTTNGEYVFAEREQPDPILTYQEANREAIKIINDLKEKEATT